MLLSATNTGLDIFLIVWVVVIIATVIGELLTADLSCIWFTGGGIIALILVDLAQLKIPEIYSTIIDGLNGEGTPLTKTMLLSFCKELFIVIAIMVSGRMLWRICFYGSAIQTSKLLRKRMFNHAKDLPQEYYSKNKVGGLMSLFTNDINTIQECFGDGILYLFDAIGLGSLAIYKMFKLNSTLALLSIIPLILLII